MKISRRAFRFAGQASALFSDMANYSQFLIKTAFVAFFLTVQLGNAAQAQNPSPSSQTRINYDVSYAATGYGWLDKLIHENSLLFQLKSRPPLTAAGLRRRVKRDKILLADLLQSEGFYAGKVEIIQNRGSRIGQAIFAKVSPGPVFKNKNYEITYDQDIEVSEKNELQRLAKEKFKIFGRASSAAILETEQALLLHLANNGFPFTKMSDRVVTVDHADKTVSTKLSLELGPRSTYGTTLFSGLKTVDSNFLLKRMKLPEGREFSQEELDEAKKRLLNTGLFTNVNIRIPKTAPNYGSVPLVVEVRERAKHQVRISAGASINDGPKGSIEWRHRNLLGKAQNLIVKVEGDKNKVKGTTTFEWPDYLRDDQILSSGISAEYDGTDNLENTTLSANVKLGRWYDKRRTFISAGPEIEYIRDSVGADVWLASFPVNLDLNRSDSLLNPGKGYRFFADLVPYINLDNANQVFLKSELGASTYTPILGGNRLTLATWAKAGAILGEDLANIPTSKRFYLGGSGSVRAFSAKGISAPGFSGALGKLEGGLELRTRFNASFGAVAFIEGGRVFESLDDDLKSGWKAGAGLGFRYYTAFGPVRVDVAAPVTEKLDIDKVQIQVGLGQAF